jgi:nicotinamide riboside kinase
MKKIVVTGVESSGKTTLAIDLANKLNARYVSEYSREYLTHLTRPYLQEDLLKITHGQLRSELEAEQNSPDLIICDTSLLVLKVWSEYKYGYCDPWILDQFENHNWDMFLLPHYDIPFEDDPLRENPKDRDVLFEIYLKELERLQIPFHILHGSPQDRLAQAIDAIQSSYVV